MVGLQPAYVTWFVAYHVGFINTPEGVGFRLATAVSTTVGDPCPGTVLSVSSILYWVSPLVSVLSPRVTTQYPPHNKTWVGQRVLSRGWWARGIESATHRLGRAEYGPLWQAREPVLA